MSREIKFRAWDAKSKNMSERFNLFGEFTMLGAVFAWLDHVRGCEVANGVESLNDLSVMQFTGLKDKEGVEIYSGDIVSFSVWWFDGDVRETVLTGQIVYSDANMSFQLKGVKNKEWENHTGFENDCDYLTPFSELNFDDADFRVIGNIHQNPELLESAK